MNHREREPFFPLPGIRVEGLVRKCLPVVVAAFLVSGCAPRGGTGDPLGRGGNPYYHFLLGEEYRHQAESLGLSGEEGSKEKSAQALLEAIDEFRLVLLVDPDACEAREEIVECLVELGRKEDAAFEIDQALDRGCGDAALHERKGMLALERGDSETAADAFEGALAIDADRVRAGVKLAEMKEEDGDNEGALDILAGIRTVPPKLQSWIARWRARLLSGEFRWEEAIDIIDGTLAQLPGDARLFEIRAGLLERMGDIAGARDSYFEVLARSPFDRNAIREAARLCSYIEDVLCINFLVGHFENTDGASDPWHLYLRVAGLVALGTPEYAARVLREFENNFGDEPEFSFWSGRVAEALGLDVDAERAYRETVRVEPGHDQAVSSLVLLLVKQDRYGEALDLLEAGIAFESGDPYQHFMLGLLLFELEDYAGAMNGFLDARKLGMVRHEFLDLNLGSVMEKLGDYTGAEENFRRSLELNPMNYDAMNYIAYMHAERGEGLDEGLELAARADSLNPDNPFILDTIAWLYYKKGDLEAAGDFIERALEINRDPEILLHSGDILKARGRPGEAEMRWDEALEAIGRPEEQPRGEGDNPESAE